MQQAFNHQNPIHNVLQKLKEQKEAEKVQQSAYQGQTMQNVPATTRPNAGLSSFQLGIRNEAQIAALRETQNPSEEKYLFGAVLRHNGQTGGFWSGKGKLKVPEGAQGLILSMKHTWARLGVSPVIFAPILEDGTIPARETLSHTDSSEWSLGPDDKPSDPWCFMLYLAGEWRGDFQFGEQFTLAVDTKRITAYMPAKALIRAIAEKQEQYPGATPIVEFESIKQSGQRSYFRPKYNIVGWVDVTGRPLVEGQPKPMGTIIDDSINY